MKNLTTLVNQLQDFCVAGTDLRQVESIVQAIDICGKSILSTLGFAPGVVPHVALFQKQADERLNDVQEVISSVGNAPESAVPYVINAYCASIRKTVGRDLLAFATDFSAGLNLRFRVSFSSFANSFSSTHQDIEKRRIQIRLQEMRDEGYVLELSKRKKHVLTDCDKNRNLLRSYCLKTFGVEPLEIRTHRNSIRDLDMVVHYDKYIPTPKIPEEPPASSQILTADNAIRLSKAISDVKFATASYPMMEEAGDGDLLLSCLQEQVYEIECITGIHGNIWEEREKEIMDVRRKNQQIRAVEEKLQRVATDELAPRIRDIIREAKEKMEDLACQMGFCLNQFSLSEYNQIDLVFIANRILFDAPKVKLDGHMDDKECKFFVYNSQENLKKILETVQFVLPSASLESYQAKPHMDFQYIQEIHIRSSNPGDMMRILRMGNI